MVLTAVFERTIPFPTHSLDDWQDDVFSFHSPGFSQRERVYRVNILWHSVVKSMH
jgi:hypothetical protein